MKSITLSAAGITFDTSFKTVVTKVVNPDEKSSIVLDALPNIKISLGEQSAKSLGIEKDTQVTIKPIDGATDGTFTLEVGEKAAPKKAAPLRSAGNGCARPLEISNNF
jgi:hypothetical protein